MNPSITHSQCKVGRYDDGWGLEDAEPKQLQTTLTAEKARKIISTNDSPEGGFNQSINPYNGCEHGRVYYSVTHSEHGRTTGMVIDPY